MLHECHHCNEHKGIQAFHNSQDDQICQDCYEFEEDVKKAVILHERQRLKEMLQQIDLEELPF